MLTDKRIALYFPLAIFSWFWYINDSDKKCPLLCP
jgi:hypothetical protein